MKMFCAFTKLLSITEWHHSIPLTYTCRGEETGEFRHFKWYRISKAR